MTSSKFNPEQLVFFVGIPGSGWAKIDSMMRCCKKFNFSISDYSDSRRFQRTSKVEAHMTPLEANKSYKGYIHGHPDYYYIEHKGHFSEGHFSGPGCEFGEGFEDLSKHYTKESFIEEALKPYKEINSVQHYMIKCHYFCEPHNLKWLKNNFPDNKWIFVFRDWELCNHRWLTSMTFEKDYPKYTAWQVFSDPNDDIDKHDPRNIENFCKKNNHHNLSMRKFFRRSKDPTFIACPTKHLLNKLDYIWDIEGNKEYLAYNRNYCDGNFLDLAPRWDTSIGFMNCQGIIDFA